MKVSELYIYPIKSCAGIKVDSAEIAPTGFVNDRLLMLTNLSGHFLSQRSVPKMALIQPSFVETQDFASVQKMMRLDAPGMASMTVAIKREGDAEQVIVWGDWCFGVDQGDEIAAWLSAFLGIECRLTAMLAGSRRPVDPDFAISDNDITSFSDAYPFLMISQASLDQLNSKMGTDVGMDRFRPNIVIADAEPHEEDTMGVWQIGDIAFSAVKLCARCAIPNIDQATAKPGLEPNKTLATYRRFNNKIYFGNNLIQHSSGTIRVGDTVTFKEENQ